MARPEGARPGQPEVLEFGSSRRRRWRLPRWLAPVVVLLIAAGVAVFVVVTAAPVKKHSAAHGPVTVTSVGHPLLGVRAGWELFGLGSGGVVRIQLAAGRITRTTVPALLSTGPVTFLAGPHQVIIRPLDFVPGYLVPDGQPAQALRAALSRGGTVLPGPRPGQFWVQDAGGRQPLMSLVGQDGSKLGAAIPIPASGRWPVISDGRGYLLIHRAGRIYDARPGTRHLITSGTVAAVGPTRWLTVACQRRHHCLDVVIDSVTGARRVLAGPRLSTIAPAGVISPDGSAAALFRVRAGGQTTIQLLSLASGTDHAIPVHPNQESFDLGAVAWSPDSQWLFVVTADGRIVAVSARTGRVRGLGVALPPVSQLAVR
jgi:hypothetical protein